MELDRAACLAALKARDARFDGRFFTAVRSTGIYCRPVCPARTPRAENVTFYSCAAAAEQSGFRPCRRCRPELAPGTHPTGASGSALVLRALRLIADGELDRSSVEQLGARLGCGSRVLRRRFQSELGVAPVKVAQTRRVHFARRLLDETGDPVHAIAAAAGFGSVRRFQHVFRRTFGRTPLEVRSLRGAPRPAPSAGAEHAIRLSYREPFDWEAMLGFLAARATPHVEWIDPGGGGEYSRVVRVEGSVGILRVRRDRDRRGLLLRVPGGMGRALLDLSTRARRLFDLDADPAAIARTLGEDAALRGPLGRHPGLRVPGTWDPFETAVRAVLGQQVTVRGATTLMGRLVREFGERLPDAQGGDAGACYLFPPATRLADAPLESIGMPRARAGTIRELARATLGEADPLARAPSHALAIARLLALPGIGPWTAEYIAMRVLGETDAFPAGDLVLRRALAGADTDRWRPWRAYAAMLLWQNAADASPPARRGAHPTRSGPATPTPTPGRPS